MIDDHGKCIVLTAGTEWAMVKQWQQKGAVIQCKFGIDACWIEIWTSNFERSTQKLLFSEKRVPA
jgi:hypothetical protein